MKFKVNVKVTEVYNKSFIVEARSKEEAERKLEKKWNEELYDAITDCVEEQNVEYSCAGKATKQDVNECDSLDDYIDEDENENKDEDEDDEDTDDEEILEAVNQYGINVPNEKDTVILYIAPMDIMNFKGPESFMAENFGYCGIYRNVYNKKGEIKKAAIVAIKSVNDELVFLLSDGKDQYDKPVFELSNPEDTLRYTKELVTEGLDSDERDWLVLYNSVFKYGAPKGIDIWRHYDGVYLPGAEIENPHGDISDTKENKHKILNALRAEEYPKDIIERLIP